MRKLLTQLCRPRKKKKKNPDESRKLCLNANTLEEFFWAAAQKGGDNSQWSINELLPTIRLLAEDSECRSAWEFGTAQCRSSCALLLGGISDLTSVDVEKDPVVDHFSTLSREAGKKWRQCLSDSAEVEIDPCDLLLIDSLHNGEHLSKELRSGHKVKKLILLHDTVTYWEQGSNGSGLKDAVINFLQENPEWEIAYEFVFNNGLMALRRTR